MNLRKLLQRVRKSIAKGLDQPMDQEQSYRQLIGNLPFSPDGLKIELITRMPDDDNQTYLVLHSADKDIVLHLNIDWNDGSIIASKRFNNLWSNPVRAKAQLVKDGTRIALSFHQNSVDILTEGIRTIEWPLNIALNKISSLDVSGAWTTDLTSSFDIKLPDQILRQLPGNRKDQNMYQADLIFDIGMNNGDDTDFYLKKGFRVISIEAIPTLCALAADRFRDEIASGQLIICNMGVSVCSGELSFYINHNHNEWSSFDPDIASRGHPVTEVKICTATPEDFFNEFGIPYYCKIDIEGLDYAVVKAIPQLKAKPKYVSFENGHLHDFEALAAAGYDSFQLIEQSSIPQRRLPKPSLEGNTIQYRFSHGSSGPFGKDLTGTWWSTDKTRTMLKKHHSDLAARKVRGYDWWDLHARHCNSDQDN